MTHQGQQLCFPPPKNNQTKIVYLMMLAEMSVFNIKV